ncbi:MAG: hypothetical protein O2955_22005 [Planctomycetota bacterium]|nr:hypothetical protein [Planctomycetota bacterium]MDA1215182.1 hypothetical protein [Planctomycetota bacterium]
MDEGSVHNLFRPVFTHPCWGLHYRRQLSLSINFGNPSLRIREPIASKSQSKRVQENMARRLVTLRGEWWLWIYLCYWRISYKNKQLATGSSSSKKIADALWQLEGEKMTSVQFNAKRGITEFSFDLGSTLTCRPMTQDPDAELWFFYLPDGNVAVARRDGTVMVEPANTSPARSG